MRRVKHYFNSSTVKEVLACDEFEYCKDCHLIRICKLKPKDWDEEKVIFT